VDSTSGKKVSELKLASPPVLNGIAAANGRLFVATVRGDILCLGVR